jgi:hypothetical protein
VTAEFSSWSERNGMATAGGAPALTAFHLRGLTDEIQPTHDLGHDDTFE